MLILMRRTGETIFIGDNIKVTVVSVERNRVRLGIQAPTNVVIDREELRERKNRELTEQALRADAIEPVF